jgi:hypothetical protein
MTTHRSALSKLAVLTSGAMGGFALAWGLGAALPPRESDVARLNGASKKVDVDRLEARLSALETFVNAERILPRENRLAAGATSSAAEPGPEEENDMRKPPPSSPRAEAAPGEYVRGLDSTFDAEPLDSAWSKKSEAQLWARATAALPPASKILSLQCRSSICRIETAHSSMDAYWDFTHAALAADDDFKNGIQFAAVRERNDREVTGVLYAARQDRSLPTPLDFASAEHQHP